MRGRRGARTGIRLADRSDLAVFLGHGNAHVSNACSGEPGEVPDNEVEAHPGNLGSSHRVPRQRASSHRVYRVFHHESVAIGAGSMIPNFLVIGAAKSATTSLCGVLGRHPQVFMCDPKEPHFFSRPECYARGIRWYEGLFDGAGPAIAVGEGSATYTHPLFARLASERIAATLPETRLIYCVRHPLRRIESHWVHHRCREFTPADFACGIKDIPADFDRSLRRSEDLIGASLYRREIGLYRRFFPDSRIHVVFFEDFVRDPESTLRDCLEFPRRGPPADAPPRRRGIGTRRVTRWSRPGCTRR